RRPQFSCSSTINFKRSLNRATPIEADMRLILVSLALSTACLWGQEDHQRHEHAVSGLGSVNFPTSCAPAAQNRFTRAVALLHSFGYEEARRTFAEVGESDQRCAMAHWGVAMTWYHPIWAPPNAAELKQGAAAIERAQGIPAGSAREKAYIAALARFYQDWQSLDHRTRATSYVSAMAEAHQRYPHDDEASIFYALALLGNLDQSDRNYTRQKEAAKLVNGVLPKNPNHPGVAHYLIHSYDYP